MGEISLTLLKNPEVLTDDVKFGKIKLPNSPIKEKRSNNLIRPNGDWKTS